MKYILSFLLLVVGCRQTVIDESKVIDLTYTFDEHTVYWPTAKKFELKKVAFGSNESGEWYASNDFCASEHGGTHLDAPIHFAKDRRTTAEIPLGQLIGPARVVDIRDQCAQDRDYLLSAADLLADEERYGKIAAASVVLVQTGYSRFYGEPKRYLGSDRRGVLEDLHFPGIGGDAAQLLVDRRIDLVGIDTASVDHGPSRHFEAHRILCQANIPALENVAQMERLPPRGALVIALPMKIADGTGAPCRVIAVLP